MVKKPNEWPRRRELVIGTVTRVTPYSAMVSLEEYGNKEGMVHVSEVARKWVKDIRKYVKEGKKAVFLVMYTDIEKGHITLSLKRVTRYDSEERMKAFKREQKAEKMLEQAAKEMKTTLDKAYKEVGFTLQEEFGEIFKAFQMTLTEKGLQTLKKKDIPENWINAIRKIAESQMEIKEVTIKGELDLKCETSDGVEVIKSSLKEAKKKFKVDIHYISSPKYSIETKTKDPKKGEKKIQEAAEFIEESVKKSGGECSFEMIR